MEGVAGGRWLLWVLVSLFLFVGFHWLLGKTLRKTAQTTFCDSRFLSLVGWLGLMLTGVYWITGSLWLIAFIHWGAVMVWIYGLGGRQRLQPGWSEQSRQRAMSC